MIYGEMLIVSVLLAHCFAYNVSSIEFTMMSI